MLRKLRRTVGRFIAQMDLRKVIHHSPASRLSALPYDPAGRLSAHPGLPLAYGRPLVAFVFSGIIAVGWLHFSPSWAKPIPIDFFDISLVSDNPKRTKKFSLVGRSQLNENLCEVCPRIFHFVPTATSVQRKGTEGKSILANLY